MSATPQVDYKSISTVQAYARLNTDQLFLGQPPTDSYSPLDQFIINTNSINVIYLNATAPLGGVSPPIPPELGTVVLLGYMSAVESYFRAIVRGLIRVDDLVRNLAEPMTVTYAAALHHSRDLLPEALTEHLSFAGAKSIVGMLRDPLGIKQNLPVAIESIVKEFAKVCEIRHCCVHRFGRLGSKTAIVLGMEQHKTMLERPFTPTGQDLQLIADLLRTFVKSINNFVFQSIIERVNQHDRDSFRYSWQWTWDKRVDLARFRRYYRLFATAQDSEASPADTELYDNFRTAMLSRERTRNSRGAR